MKKKYILFILLCFITIQYCFAQVPVKDDDFKCFNKGAYQTFDFLKSTRSYGGYEPENEWSQALSSGQILRKNAELDGGRQYVILLATEKGCDATAIEIRDELGVQQEYIYKISELDKDEITLFYTPVSDGNYQIYFRVLNSKQSLSCTYIAVLEGQLDPEYITGKERETQEDEY